MATEEIITERAKKLPQDAFGVISYLREDIQDTKSEIREIRNLIDKNYKELNNKILNIDSRFNNMNNQLNSPFDYIQGEICDSFMVSGVET